MTLGLLGLPRVLSLALAASAAQPAAGSEAVHELLSPDGRVVVRVSVAERLTYDVSFVQTPLLEAAALSLNVDGAWLGRAPRFRAVETRAVDRVVTPAVARKAATLREQFNELRLTMEGGYSVVFRAFDEGVAYRFETAMDRASVEVLAEEVSMSFAGDWPVLFHREKQLFSHNERHYERSALSGLSADALATTPAVVEAPGGVRIAIADADIVSYPGLWLRGTGGPTLSGTFPARPLKESLERDRDFKVVERADHIAETAGTRSFPWRVLGIAASDADLLTNELVFLLSEPSRIADTSWIEPGKVAWDWYNANNLEGVDFEAGVNTKTYEHYIDFASAHGIEYVILDEGWYELGDLRRISKDMDVEHLIRYAADRDVGIILWVVWKTLDDQLETAMNQFEAWGVRGLKVDFMQRDDQPVIDFYHRVAREAAERKMLLDFHGGIRPAQMTRTWPHLLTAEGVIGLEHNKWSADASPEHNVTLPFTRMFVGPLDYTPGAMRNASRTSHEAIFEQPMSLTTRCHQLAMYVVFESPLQMLADSPSLYRREPEMMEFLGPVPTVWDETRVVEARLGDYVVMARRKGTEWWIGAMTDDSPRELEISLGFLPEGDFEMTSYRDGANARRWASDYRKSTARVDRSEVVEVALAPGGGFAAHLEPASRTTPPEHEE